MVNLIDRRKRLQSLGRRREAAVRPQVQWRGSQILLQRFQLVEGFRQRDVQNFCGAGEAARLCRRRKCAELFERDRFGCRP
jgi:hypothetical protein